MENLPLVKEHHRVPLTWPSSPYLADHRFLGKAVLPAVESMELLAAAVKSIYPVKSASVLASVELKRFLPLDAGARALSADMLLMENGSIRAALISEIKARGGAVTRTMEHVSLVFEEAATGVSPLPLDVAAGLLGVARRVNGGRLYGEMVPFGPAYHNAESVFITDEGAAMVVLSGKACGEERVLGSPFTLDAAFHGACAWGQCILRFVGFPVSMKKRIVLKPTEPGERYFARVFPEVRAADFFTADVHIYGFDGTLHETVAGLVMKDITGGKLAPPPWAVRDDSSKELLPLKKQCDAFALIELDAIPDFAHQSFTTNELERFRSMGEKRRRSYAGARLACKRLYRKLVGDGDSLPPGSIETTMDDSDRPCIPRLPVTVTVSHDGRFAVAAASGRPIGIDVERLHERLVKVKKYYARDEENPVIRGFFMGETHALLRIWTAKEAAAKALGATLAEAWNRTTVTVLGEHESVLVIDGREITALHGAVDDHLFTVVIV